MKKIIIFSGKAQHGKDTSAEIMMDKLTSEGYKCIRCAFGDYVKFACKQYYKWNGEKDEFGRWLLQNVGTDKVRNKLPDFWVKRIYEDIEHIIKDDFDYIFITDARFPNEIDLLKEKYKELCTAIRVIRSNFESPLTEEQQEHESETSLDDYKKFDYKIMSESGIENLISPLNEIIINERMFD